VALRRRQRAPSLIGVGLSLRRMVGSEISAFVETSRALYIVERVVSGDDVASATRSADEQIAAMFPNGEPGPGHLLYHLEEEGETVGWLWIGPASPDQLDSWWVWDIAIDESHRGRGLGKAAMLLAESEARAGGGTELGLNVFGHNSVARKLYEGLGYETVAIRMTKPL
jgi:ribosomal protein S18 acetylase RimI-like enzyme